MKKRLTYLVVLFILCISYGYITNYANQRETIRQLKHPSTISVLDRMKMIVDEDDEKNISLIEDQETKKQIIFLKIVDHDDNILKEESIVFIKKSIIEIFQNNDDILSVIVESHSLTNQQVLKLEFTKGIVKSHPEILKYKIREFILWSKDNCLKFVESRKTPFCYISENY